MKLFLLDGHALVFKMYYAFLGRPMVNSKGVDTSILFGFTKYLLELIDREKPTHIAVSFDPPGGTFRNQLYPEYKANRSETPQLVIDALEPLTAIVKALDIPVLMIPGFEADDVIGSMAVRSAAEGFDVYMVTPDKDYGQLVAPHIWQYKPGKSGADNEVLGEAQICEKWGIQNTAQVIDILTICGDSSDNVPGVQGVGPVGASKLLGKYGTTDGVYEHLGELTPRQQQLFEAARGHIALSRELVTIKTDIPLETTAADMILDLQWNQDVENLFKLYEFPSLIRLAKKISDAIWQGRDFSTSLEMTNEGSGMTNGGVGAASEVVKRSQKDVPGTVCAHAVVSGGDPGARASGGDGFFEASSGWFEKSSSGDIFLRSATKSEITDNRIAILLDNEKLYIADSHGVASGKPEDFKDILENPEITKAGIGLKAQMNALALQGITLAGKVQDIELLHYLLNPEASHKLQDLARTFLGVELEDAAPEAQMSLFDEAPEADRSKDAAVLIPLADALFARMDATDPRLRTLYEQVEEPLEGVLARMEQTGVRIDPAALRSFADGLRTGADSLEKQIRELAGAPDLNINSPKQIGEVLFEKMRLDPRAKKPSKGNWPTDEKTLQELADRSPIIGMILDYRGLRKLLGTYIDPLPGYISPRDGRVHTTFNQALTATGRLSSSNPNLQNIPIRTEQGREIRRAFVPQESGCVIMSADYSQIELRIMAHLSGDEHLSEAFRSGVDVHAATAAKIFGIPIQDVTSDQRRIAKTANFGIMYGISAFGLSQNLGCPRSEAKRLIEDYFASFPSIRAWIDGTLEGARRNGYVETLLGRRRYVPDITSGNATVRAYAERNAVNAPIQGTSADIIKLAMIAVDRRLREQRLRSRMVLQIHDELLLEVPEAEIDTVRDMLIREMQGVIALNVPLTVECNYGTDWLQAH
ncbi:MAG: DNA polymerase I [Bacteroidales bacterium]|nr:DNA polymerase I [Bacteroidales bacterium]